MFGKVGYADATLREDGSSYKMTLVAKLVGKAASLTGNRAESYISEGKIVDGKYIPDTFYKMRKTDSKDSVKKYTFNHEAKTVTLDSKSTKIINGTKFDVHTFKIVATQEIKKSESSEVLKEYIGSDILSSYLNAKRVQSENKGDFNLVAIGARNDRNNITISILNELRKEEVSKNFSVSIENVYNLHVEPLDKDDTTVDILIAYDNDGLMKEAVLGDSFWIGEVKATRSYHNVASK
jgi:hypothetical protein